MKKDILMNLFEELLDRWYWAEDSCIKNMSYNCREESEKQKQFEKALHD